MPPHLGRASSAAMRAGPKPGWPRAKATLLAHRRVREGCLHQGAAGRGEAEGLPVDAEWRAPEPLAVEVTADRDSGRDKAAEPQRPSASSRSCETSGPTPAPTAPAPSGRTSSRAGSTATMLAGHTAVSAGLYPPHACKQRSREEHLAKPSPLPLDRFGCVLDPQDEIAAIPRGSIRKQLENPLTTETLGIRQ